MKKAWIVLLLSLAVSAPAGAQSTVRVFGVQDFTSFYPSDGATNPPDEPVRASIDMSFFVSPPHGTWRRVRLTSFSLDLGYRTWELADVDAEVRHSATFVNVAVGQPFRDARILRLETDDFTFNVGASLPASGDTGLALVATLSVAREGAPGTWTANNFPSTINITAVSIPPVPEPAHYVLLLFGLGLVGGIVSRRKRMPGE